MSTHGEINSVSEGVGGRRCLDGEREEWRDKERKGRWEEGTDGWREREIQKGGRSERRKKGGKEG